MEKPIRLQLSRRKGFNLQELSLATNGLPAVIVSRPGKWGNPFIVGLSRGSGTGVNYVEEKIHDNATAVRFFREMLDFKARNYPSANEISALRGKNLACWCRKGVPCHADILLALANPICEEE